MIVAPPFDDGFVNVTVNLPELAVTALIVGALAVGRGVTDTADDAVPFPAEFTARNLTAYVVPFTRALAASERIVITTGVVVSAGLNAFQVVPLFVEYS